MLHFRNSNLARRPLLTTLVGNCVGDFSPSSRVFTYCGLGRNVHLWVEGRDTLRTPAVKFTRGYTGDIAMQLAYSLLKAVAKAK